MWGTEVHFILENKTEVPRLRVPFPARFARARSRSARDDKLILGLILARLLRKSGLKP